MTCGLDESSLPGADQPALLSCSASLSVSQIQPWAKEQVTNPGTVLPPESPAAQRGKQPVAAGVGVSLRVLSGAERSPLDPSCSLRINICTYHHVLFWKPQQPCQARLAMLNCKALWVELPCLSQLMFTAYLRAREYGCGASVRGLVTVTSPSVSESNCRQQAERCPNLWKHGSREERTIKVTGWRWKWGHSPCVSKTSPLAAAPPATSFFPSVAACRSAAISSDACGSFSGLRFPVLDAGGAQGCPRWERCLAGLGPRWLSLMADLERQTLPGTNCSAT